MLIGAKDSTVETVQDAGSKIGEKTGEAKDYVKETGSRMADRAHDAKESAKDAGSRAWESVQETGSKISSKMGGNTL